MIKLKFLPILVIGIFFLSCEKNSDNKHSVANNSASSAQTSSLESKTSQTSSASSVLTNQKGTLLFFMNPEGGPCIMQDNIIKGMQNKMAKKVDVAYIKTTNSMDRDAFYKYGIRALPTLIILDKTGQVATRFAPGIQDQDAILAAIKQLD